MATGSFPVRRRIAIASLLMWSVGRAPALAAPKCAASPFRNAKPLVIAHASSSYFGPGNTIAMMRAAVAAGADVLDADVRVTADGIPVAAHDDLVATDTNNPVSIRRTQLPALREVDVASGWKDPRGRFSLRGKGVRVPTIEEILVAFPGRRLSLEFKVTGGERAVCTLLRRLHRTHDVYVSSDGDAPIDNFKPLCPEVVTTVTDAIVVEMRAAREHGSAWCSPAPIGQPSFHRRDGSALTAESIRWNHEHGLAVYTWTVDDPTGLQEAARIGVDGVYTGRSDLARKIFDAPR